MPRQARLDAPGTLHHVIVRGLDRGAVVRDEIDRAAFVARLGDVAQATGTAIYAWALLPNHAHLLLRSAPAGLPRFMRRLLTGYAISFNHRHRRVGHLFQNRYKSIVVEADNYFRELVRYIHLNPLRAKQAGTPPRSTASPGAGTPRCSAGLRTPGRIAGGSWAGLARRTGPPSAPTARLSGQGSRSVDDPNWWAAA